MSKRATTDFPIHDLLAERWSPRAFAPKALSRDELGSLLEAARWAASCYNEQPWRFLIATQDDKGHFEDLASCILEGNSWAKDAPLLMLSVAKKTFTRNGKANRHASHDVGLAVGNLTTQAQAMGLVCHQLGGFDAEKATETLGIPDDYEAIAMIAIGYRGSTEGLPQELAERERATRSRLSLAEFAFGASWEEPLNL